MFEFNDLTYINNFSIKTAGAISAEAMQIVLFSMPSLDNKVFTLTITNEDGSIVEVVDAGYIEDTSNLEEGSGGPSGFVLAVRGKQGTTARAWPAGSHVYCSLTAEFANEVVSRLKAADAKIAALEGVLGGYTGRLQVNFLFDTPRDGTLDRVTELKKIKFIGDDAYSAASKNQVAMPLSIFELEGSAAFVLTGPLVSRARLVLEKGYGDQTTNATAQIMRISVTGAASSYAGDCEVAQPATIQIVQDGMVLGEERVEWPAKLSNAVYHIEYQFF